MCNVWPTSLSTSEPTLGRGSMNVQSVTWPLWLTHSSCTTQPILSKTKEGEALVKDCTPLQIGDTSVPVISPLLKKAPTV